MRLFRIIAAIFPLVFVSTAFAGGAETSAFLKKHYGWTLELEKKSIFEWRWNIVCHPSRQAFPQSWKTLSQNSICHQEDRAYWTVIYWRLPSVEPDAVRRMVFNAMAGKGNKPDGIVCTAGEPFIAEGKARGVIEDCAVELSHGKYFVSFYHFDAAVPAPYQTAEKSISDVKTSNALSFTLWVQNAQQSDPAVKEKLRELARAVRFSSDP